jgi:tetratricopeptide (TPR) repeat protein
MSWVSLLVTGILVLAPLANAEPSPKDLLAAGRVDELVQRLQKNIAATPRDSESYNLLCRAYFSLEDWDHAISACEHAVTAAPEVSLYHLWLGRAYGEKADRVTFFSAAGMAKKVRTEFERSVQLAPDSWEARADLAEFYAEAPGIVGGGKDKARSQADSLMKLNPAIAHYILGRLAEKNKDNAAAEKEYRAAIEASHGGAHAWLNLALFYRHSSRFDEMEVALHSMAKAQLDRPESLMDGGSILLRTGRNPAFGAQLVRQYLQSTLVEAGPAFKAHCVLGELLEKQGDARGAAEQYRAALSLAHNYSKAQEGLKRVGS